MNLRDPRSAWDRALWLLKLAAASRGIGLYDRLGEGLGAHHYTREGEFRWSVELGWTADASRVAIETARNGLGLTAGVAPLSLSVAVGAPPVRWLLNALGLDDRDREWGVWCAGNLRSDSGPTVGWSLGASPFGAHDFSGEDGDARKGYAHPLDDLLGPVEVTREILWSTVWTVPMPEGQYPCTVMASVYVSRRPRWPVDWSREYVIHIDVPSGIDMGPLVGRSYGLTLAYGDGDDARTAAEAMRADVMAARPSPDYRPARCVRRCWEDVAQDAAEPRWEERDLFTGRWVRLADDDARAARDAVAAMGADPMPGKFVVDERAPRFELAERACPACGAEYGRPCNVTTFSGSGECPNGGLRRPVEGDVEVEGD